MEGGGGGGAISISPPLSLNDMAAVSSFLPNTIATKLPFARIKKRKEKQGFV